MMADDKKEAAAPAAAAAPAKKAEKSAPVRRQKGSQSLPGHEDHEANIAGSAPETGNEAVPAMPANVTMSDGAPTANGPDETGIDAVPGQKAKDWKPEPRHEEHPMTQESPTIGADALPANPMANEDVSDGMSAATNMLRLAGMKDMDAARVPSALTLIMPDAKGREQESKKMAVTSGKTLVIKRDEFRGFTDREAEWLNGHDTFEFEKA